MKLEHVNLLGYYKEGEIVHNENEIINPKLLYFVAYENELNYSQKCKNEGKKWIEGYNVIDGHFQLKDRAYLISCKKITKEQYIEGTKGMYTPKIYL